MRITAACRAIAEEARVALRAAGQDRCHDDYLLLAENRDELVDEGCGYRNNRSVRQWHSLYLSNRVETFIV